MFTKGPLLIYDETGKIFNYGFDEISTTEINRIYPVGLPYIELPYGTFKTKKIISVDVSKSPHEVIYEDVEIQPLPEEQIENLENELLIAKGVI